MRVFQEKVAVTFIVDLGRLGDSFSRVEDASSALAVYVQHENAFGKGSRLMTYVGYKFYRCVSKQLYPIVVGRTCKNID